MDASADASPQDQADQMHNDTVVSSSNVDASAADASPEVNKDQDQDPPAEKTELHAGSSSTKNIDSSPDPEVLGETTKGEKSFFERYTDLIDRELMIKAVDDVKKNAVSSGSTNITVVTARKSSKKRTPKVNECTPKSNVTDGSSDKPTPKNKKCTPNDKKHTRKDKKCTPKSNVTNATSEKATPKSTKCTPKDKLKHANSKKETKAEDNVKTVKRRKHYSTKEDEVAPKKRICTRNTSDKVMLDASALDKVLSRKRLAAPLKGELKEKDPLLEAFKDTSPDDLQELVNDDKQTKEKSSLVKEDKVDTKDGTICIKEYGVKRLTKKERNFACKNCDKNFRSQAKLNKHNKEDHPDAKMVCEVCKKQFSTYNAWYKHKQQHFQLPHECSFCSKKFQFPYLLKQHMGTHIDELKFPCAVSGCTKKFSNKDAEKQHRETHYKDQKQYFCNECPETEDKKDYATAQSLRQHITGEHGPGYKSFCGQKFKWPIERNQHQKVCETCKEEERKNLDLAENPLNPKIRKQVDETGHIKKISSLKKERTD